MHAVLIDPFTKTVTDVETDGTLAGIKAHVGDVTLDAVGVHYPEHRPHDLYLDDEGLYAETQAFFLLDGAFQPYGGKALLLRHDDEGASIAATLTADEVRRRTRFLGAPQ